ncbi:hypothetical protein HBI56_099920 [Parastagonospora nodorum]|uniref:Uncharacterized protein n=1 Tax=Phaeosphaeria nodorum (strain SN15 / ATCC MYA-4574 / FGSC 10173) TaxID=321614 RepID=A0A7U2I289_PHANO|nr:hypothetical protein HBH56_028850 [Parastagonospora nodorum]QRC99149.1 hypothetical protein JI435_304650 [Parastagonospora nodorum SN15]KAH3934176.1 hypothetical protein HBH54_053190 [Parastagonospora nodorum]KAH3949712.1 hypothetical protein HBH53_080860 [Parastagonospora nodorum]KAH3975843.1 hypothetical protein HBH51_084490 [Parastagonospora nodorum]
MGGMMSGFDEFIARVTANTDSKRKRDDGGDIPRPFMRGGGDGEWNGAATGANAIGVKRIKGEAL